VERGLGGDRLGGLVPERRDPTAVGGVRLALDHPPLGAQLFAVGTQVLAYFVTLPPSERLLTIAILAIGAAQIIISRPRAKNPEETSPALSITSDRLRPRGTSNRTTGAKPWNSTRSPRS
jgi:hypothetical protein